MPGKALQKDTKKENKMLMIHLETPRLIWKHTSINLDLLTQCSCQLILKTRRKIYFTNIDQQ